MSKDVNNKEKKGIAIKIITAILVLFTAFCIFIIIKNKNYYLISGTVGLVMLILAMNIANLIKVNKEKAKLVSIISIVLSLVSIPLAFKRVIFSYILAVPAFILANKSAKADNKNILTKISFAITLIILIVFIALSIMGGIKNM